jgi:crotonobetainyl-CoA:carnitine CoA-transferase CaiB-like acyl-CoA transferase
MAQAMMFESVTGEVSTPWSVKASPWPVYDLFETRDGERVFLSIVGEEQWEGFCRSFGFDSWLADRRLATSQGRVDNREWIIPAIADVLKRHDMPELCSTFERLGLPFAPVNKPGDLFHDPHLNASGGLMDITLNDGRRVKTPVLPFSINGERLQKRRDPPQLGEHTEEVLAELDRTKPA